MRSTTGITSGGAFGPAGASVADVVLRMAAAVREQPEPGRGVQAAQEAEAWLGLLEAASAKLLGCVAVMDADGVVERDVSLTPATWLARRTLDSRGKAATMVGLARRLHTDGVRPLRATAQALVAGEVTLAQAQAIADATATADPELVPALEAVLLEHADLPAVSLRRSAHALVQRLREQADTEVEASRRAATSEDDALPGTAGPGRDAGPASGPHRGGRWLTLTETFQGWTRVEAMLDPADTALLRAALHPLAKPLATLDSDGRRCHDPRSRGERMVDALISVVELAGRAPDAPTSGGSRAHVTVVVDADRLLAADAARRTVADQLALPPPGDPPETSGLLDLAGAYLAAGEGTGLVGCRTLDGGEIDTATLARLWCDAVVDWALVTTDPARIRAAREGPPAQQGIPRCSGRVAARDEEAVDLHPTTPATTPAATPAARPALPGGIDERLVREVLTAVSPALGGTPLEVLAMGQQIRTANRPQRRASIIGARGCAVHGCDVPARYCQVHHEEEFAEGGPTDHANHALLCPGHHRLVHHYGWTLRRDHTRGRVHLDPPPGLDLWADDPRPDIA